MKAIGLALYAACVDFMLQLAALTGLTYRDVNVLVLLVAMPLLTLGLLVVVIAQGVSPRRDRRSR